MLISLTDQYQYIACRDIVNKTSYQFRLDNAQIILRHQATSMKHNLTIYIYIYIDLQGYNKTAYLSVKAYKT